jgi:predicted nucleic acid-binding Zn ribbon protein
VAVCDPAREVDATVDDKQRRRRQRRRAVIAWGTFALIAVLVALGIVFGGDDNSDPGPTIHLFTYEMSSVQYKQLHKGEGELAVLKQLGSTGLHEDEVEEDSVRLFPPPPSGASCNFWRLSDAPDHIVRLCFSEDQGVLLEKTVRAPGEGSAESTLA